MKQCSGHGFLAQGADKLADAGDALLDLLATDGVAQADVYVAAEGLGRNHGDVRLIQQEPCEGLAAVDDHSTAALADELGDEEQALAFYREHKRLVPKANGYGMKYLEKLDPKAAAEIREAMEKRAKEWAKELPTREQKLKKQEEEKQKKEAAEKKGEEKKKSKKQKAKNNKN